MIYILKFVHKLNNPLINYMSPNAYQRHVRGWRTWESGEEGDAMGGVVDLTLVPARGGDGVETGHRRGCGGFGPRGV